MALPVVLPLFRILSQQHIAGAIAAVVALGAVKGEHQGKGR